MCCPALCRLACPVCARARGRWQGRPRGASMACNKSACTPPPCAGAWLVQFPGAGHGFLWEHMQGALAVTHAFLQSAADPPAGGTPGGGGDGGARSAAAGGEL